MGRSPEGVAIGVSGDAHLQNGAQPSGHVPVSVGSVHVGLVLTGP